jgi:hypothetical protein
MWLTSLRTFTNFCMKHRYFIKQDRNLHSYHNTMGGFQIRRLHLNKKFLSKQSLKSLKNGHI